MNPVLSLLDIPEVYKIFIFIASADGIVSRLDALDAVCSFREQRRLKQLADEHINEAIAYILSELKPGYVLPREPALCALLVALSAEHTVLSEDLINEAATLHSAAAPMTSLIAKRCLTPITPQA